MYSSTFLEYFYIAPIHFPRLLKTMHLH